MDTGVTEHDDVDTLLISLEEVSLSEVLATQDNALAQAVQNVLRSTNENDHPVIAAFNNRI